MKGKVTDRKKIKTPFGEIEMLTKEYPPYPKRKKIISWMGGDGIIKLGELITTYHVDPKRRSDFEPMKYVPLYYKIELTKEADDSEIRPYFFLDEEEDLEFDDLDKAREFIQGLKCKTVKHGGVHIDSRAEFERWKKVFEIVSKEANEEVIA